MCHDEKWISIESFFNVEVKRWLKNEKHVERLSFFFLLGVGGGGVGGPYYRHCTVKYSVCRMRAHETSKQLGRATDAYFKVPPHVQIVHTLKTSIYRGARKRDGHPPTYRVKKSQERLGAAGMIFLNLFTIFIYFLFPLTEVYFLGFSWRSKRWGGRKASNRAAAPVPGPPGTRWHVLVELSFVLICNTKMGRKIENI